MNMNNETFVDQLRIIKELNTKNHSFINKSLYRMVISRPGLVNGYRSIKNNKGKTIDEGIASDSQSLNGFEERRLERLRNSLLDQTWHPRPARIPKPGNPQGKGHKGYKVYLEEKTVQASLMAVLQAVYEPILSSQSRPGFTAFKVLKDIETKYDGISFFIEGNIKGMYDNINHHTLMNLVSCKIADHRLTALLWKFLRAGYMENIKLCTQGFIVSPILANVYLHELDKFMSKYMKKPRGTRATPIAKIYKNQMNNKRLEKRNLILKQFKRVKYENILCRTYIEPHSYPSFPLYPLRVYYHRYADLFVIGIAGSYKFAEEIKDLVRDFLDTLSLSFLNHKTKTSNLRKEKAFFLGYHISANVAKKRGKTPTRHFVVLEAPMQTIINRLHFKGFCDRQGFPTPKKIWTIMSDYQIVNLYNITFTGLLNYYSQASHRHSLSRLQYLFRYSCAMTIATKHKSSISKVFNLYGKSIKVSYGKSGEKLIRFNEHNVFKESDKRCF